MAQDTHNEAFEFALDKKSFREEKTDSGEFGYFSGYASTFNNVDRQGDIILPGAFADSLRKNNQLKLLWQHNMDSPIGRCTDLREDGTGLYMEGRLNLGVPDGHKAYALLKAGDLDQMSIGYSVREAQSGSNGARRTIKKLDLFEISLVTYPANPMARVLNVKSVDAIEDITDVEIFLRGKGLSRDESKAVISKVKHFTVLREAERKNPQESQREAGDTNAVNELFNGIKALTQKIGGSNV